MKWIPLLSSVARLLLLGGGAAGVTDSLAGPAGLLGTGGIGSLGVLAGSLVWHGVSEFRRLKAQGALGTAPALGLHERPSGTIRAALSLKPAGWTIATSAPFFTVDDANSILVASDASEYRIKSVVDSSNAIVETPATPKPFSGQTFTLYPIGS